jgi:hypothetical protein
MPARNWRGVVFDELLDSHGHATLQDRNQLEDAIFSKLINFNRDARRGLISEAEQARMKAKIAEYTVRIKNQV